METKFEAGGPVTSAGIFKLSMGARIGTEQELGCRTGPPGFTA
jgi:hypothetical protein